VIEANYHKTIISAVFYVCVTMGCAASRGFSVFQMLTNSQ